MSRKQGIIFGLALVIFIAGFTALFAYLVKNESRNNTVLDDKIKNAKTKDNATAGITSTQAQAQAQAQTQAQAQVNQETTTDSEELSSEETPLVAKKTFTSETLKISFDYEESEDLKITEATNQLVISKDGKSWKIKFYKDDEKQDFEPWYKDHYGEKDNPSCVFNEGAIKVGSYASKLVKKSEESAKCEDGGNFAFSTDNARKVKIYQEKETTENINKILANFKFN